MRADSPYDVSLSNIWCTEFPPNFRNKMPSRGVKTTAFGMPNMHDDNRNINDEYHNIKHDNRAMYEDNRTMHEDSHGMYEENHI